MRFCIPTSFESKLIDNIAKLNKIGKNTVYEVYGSTAISPIGGGRPSVILQDISLSDIAKHIQKCHQNKIRFNFVINGTFMLAQEFDNAFKQKIVSFIRKLENIGIDMVTIANPYIVAFLRKHFPNLKICLSILSNVSTIQELRIYESMGIDRLVLSYSTNRQFQKLKMFKKMTKLPIELLTNNPCLLNCPFANYHATLDSFYSVSKGKKGPSPACPSVFCKTIRLDSMEEMIKSPWIRPADVNEYEKVGIDYLKLSGRGKTTEWITEATKAYLTETDGENFYQYIDKFSHKYFKNRYHLEEELKISIPYLPKSFIEHFKNNKFKCGDDCEKCGFCKKIAQKYIVYDEKIRDQYLKVMKKAINEELDFSESSKK